VPYTVGHLPNVEAGDKAQELSAWESGCGRELRAGSDAVVADLTSAWFVAR